MQSLPTCLDDCKVSAPMPLPTHKTPLTDESTGFLPWSLDVVLFLQLQAPGSISGSKLPTPFSVCSLCHLAHSKSQRAKQVLRSGGWLSVPDPTTFHYWNLRVWGLGLNHLAPPGTRIERTQVLFNRHRWTPRVVRERLCLRPWERYSKWLTTT